jgi:uncharacterized integral membrane protein (TIGR00698 family)
MAEDKQGWSVLWKTEDWLAVWLGFLIIVLILVGLPTKAPNFKWTTDGEYSGFAAQASAKIDGLVKTAGEKNEDALKTQLGQLKDALDKKDRKLGGDAAKAAAEVVKNVKDAGLKKKAGDLAKDVQGNAGALPAKVLSGTNLGWSLLFLVGFGLVSLLGMALLGQNLGRFVVGFPVVFIIAWVSLFLAGNYTINVYGLEYVLWCLFLGLFISNVLGLPDWLRPAVQTEYYIKIGLVILGAGILFGEIVQAGVYGIVQAFLVIAVVWYFCFWLASKKMGIDDDFSALLASAVSICGVSAAIATAGAIKGDSKKLSYVTSITLICAVPMLVIQPYIAKTFGMDELVAGAWLGGTLDTSGSVVAAGSLISERAMKIGVVVKMSQNVFIGFAAFILAIWWAYKECDLNPDHPRPSAMEIWNRFPKFVLGFMVASLVFSFLLSPEWVGKVKGTLTALRTWWFALAFTSIGLETRFGELAKLGGGKPALAFIIAQGINILWTLVLAYLLFSGVLFPAPIM